MRPRLVYRLAGHFVVSFVVDFVDKVYDKAYDKVRQGDKRPASSSGRKDESTKTTPTAAAPPYRLSADLPIGIY